MEGLLVFLWVSVINIINCQQNGYQQQYYNAARNASYYQQTANSNSRQSLPVLFPTDPEEQMKRVFEHQPSILQTSNPPPAQNSFSGSATIDQQFNTSPFQQYSPIAYSNKGQDAINIFAWTLLQKTKPPLPLENLALSPILVQFLLTILEKAASGETLNQIRQAIGGTSSNDIRNVFNVGRSATQLKLANGIFADRSAGVNTSFSDYVRQFDVVLHAVEFNNGAAAKNLINNWVSQNTDGTIPKLLADAYQTQGVQVILISAAYFQSTWMYAFHSAGQGSFRNEQRTLPNVQYMETRNRFSAEKFVFDGIGLNAVEIPYEGQTHSMVILVPDNHALQSIIEYISPERMDWIIKKISEVPPNMLTLRIPKFTVQTRSSLVNTLLKMGLVDLFTINAKLPYLINTNPGINDILQEVVIKVDERGTVASAATGAVLIPLSAASVPEKKFIVERSFIAIIIDKRHNTPLFISKVHNP